MAVSELLDRVPEPVQQVRRRIPRKWKQAVLDAAQDAAAVSGPVRMLPGFLILGAQKAGTTSLYEYLIAHPDVLECKKKEVHYFDLNAHRSVNWYRGHFPFTRTGATGRRAITGEATPYYLFHPRVPRRVSEVLPFARFIVLLREPVARTYSAYVHSVANGREHLSFEEAIAAEAGRLRGVEEQMARDPRHRTFSHGHHGYQARSRYAPQVRRWLDVFPREQFLFLKSEDLFADPATTYARVLGFLGLAPFDDVEFTPRNTRDYVPITDELRAQLEAGFAPHNAQLYELIGEDLGW